VVVSWVIVRLGGGMGRTYQLIILLDHCWRIGSVGLAGYKFVVQRLDELLAGLCSNAGWWSNIDEGHSSFLEPTPTFFDNNSLLQAIVHQSLHPI
jgi:hypothetical protein